MKRREFLRHTGTAATAAALGHGLNLSPSYARHFTAKNDRLRLGCIGVGSRGLPVTLSARRFGDIVAVCDADRVHAERAQAKLSDGRAAIHEDYRRVLDRDDIDVVTIVTPDHWHTKIAVDALRAGKDVYCEKPMTLTVDEGKLICRTVEETGRVFQVGTQQRSDPDRFLLAIALIRAGRIGKIRRVTAAIGGAPTSPSLPQMAPPPNLNWDLWQGQTTSVPYTRRRCHYEFRWWYEYSGGKMTDWGAHHVDIAQWGIGMDHTGPITVEGTASHPDVPNGYNTATEFLIRCQFPDDIEMVIRHDTDNGILFEGDRGRLFVNRGRISGAAVEQLADDPLPEGAVRDVYKNRQPGDHMRNFFECVAERDTPISDVFTHHRALTTCHLANICIRLGRSLRWNADNEQISGDDEANAWLSRKQRAGYEIG